MNSLYQRYIWPSLLFVWLRYRIRHNQVTHSSKILQAFAVLGMFFVVMSTISVWGCGLLAGAFVPRLIGLDNNYLLWDLAALVALLSWTVHVLNEAQRGDPISLDRILHLPVSPGQAFVVNYLSSLGSTVFLMAAGGFLGLVIGSLFSVGPKAILFFFPMFAFLFAMTAITYWLQGWIAGLMANPRKRQTIIVMIPIAIILITQVPVQLIQWSSQSTRLESNPPVNPKDASPPNEAKSESTPEETTVKDSSESQTPAVKSDSDASTSEADAVTPPEDTTGVEGNSLVTPTDAEVTSADAKDASIDAKNASEIGAKKKQERREAMFERLKSIASIANIAFPPLWPAGAIQSWSTGSIWNPVPMFFSLVMFLIGVQALRLSHRASLRYWRGEEDKKKIASPKTKAKAVRVQKESRLCEISLPWISEETSAVVGMTWATMKRAPEIKMFMLLPMILPLILLMVFRERMSTSNDYLKLTIICGFSTFFLLVASGVAGNMFAYDRSGFRVFVLSGMDRTRILLGRNLAFAPLLGLLSTLCIVGFAILYGVSLRSTCLAMLTTLTMLPPYFLVMNLMAILTPFPLAVGSIQPKHFDFTTVVINVWLSMILPFILMVSMIPIGVYFLTNSFLPSMAWIPWEVFVGIGMSAASFGVYRLILPWQGQLLAKREKEMLRIVTSKVE
jgi:ABC-2 type transport system permease protein